MVVVWAGAGTAGADGDAGGAAGADSTGTARAEEERARKVMSEESMVVFILLEIFLFSIEMIVIVGEFLDQC